MDETKVPEVTETPEEVPAPKAEGEEDKPQQSERTKEQIDKLTTHNKELKEERDQYKNLFEGLRPAEVPQEAQQYQEPINQAPQNQFQNINQGDVNQTFQSMIDENGYLDGNKLMTTLKSMDERAIRAELAAKQVQDANIKKDTEAREREEKQATLDVYSKYPHLDPNNVDGVEVDGEIVKFDSKMWQYVKNELESKARRGVMPSNSDYMEAADQVYQDLYGGRDMTKKEEQKKVESQKNIINATRPRSTMNVNYYKNDEESALIDQVRAGKRGAVGELLRRKGL